MVPRGCTNKTTKHHLHTALKETQGFFFPPALRLGREGKLLESSVFHMPGAISRGITNLRVFKNSAVEIRATGNIIFSSGKCTPSGASLHASHLLQSQAFPGFLGQNSHKFQGLPFSQGRGETREGGMLTQQGVWSSAQMREGSFFWA